jgi:hypothetical protein
MGPFMIQPSWMSANVATESHPVSSLSDCLLCFAGDAVIHFSVQINIEQRRTDATRT